MDIPIFDFGCNSSLLHLCKVFYGVVCICMEQQQRRSKGLDVNFFWNNKYHHYFKPEIVFQGNKNNYQLFKTRLDELRMTSNEYYLMEHKDIMRYYINTSTTGSTREAIESKFNDIITSANTQIKPAVIFL